MRNTLIIIILLSLISCKPIRKTELIGVAQGSYYSITYFSDLSEEEQVLISEGIDSIFNAVNKSVSLWDETSVICRVNANDSTVILDDIFIDNFRWAEKAWQLSGGAFDATVAPLVETYGFLKKAEIDITQKTIDSLLKFVGFEKIRIDGNKIIKDDPRVRLDFNAVAQGYTTDLISNFLLKKGIKNHLVDVGGEIMARGVKQGGTPWIVGIEKPAPDKNAERTIQESMPLTDRAVVTSGNYRKYIEDGGRRLSHSIDPRTGLPATHDLLSATVIAPTATQADCLATICMIVGREKATEMLDTIPDVEYIFLP